MKKIFLIIVLCLTHNALAAEKNQYGGYAPYTVLSATEAYELENSAKYQQIQVSLQHTVANFVEQRLQYLPDVYAAYKEKRAIPQPPQLPALTAEQKSFLRDEVILKWEEQRRIIQQDVILPFGDVHSLEKLEMSNEQLLLNLNLAESVNLTTASTVQP